MLKNKLNLSLFLVLFGSLGLHAQSADFKLDPGQSMLMFGKGPGQDATINPFEGSDCYAIVKNRGKVPFSIRIQQKGTLIETLPIGGKETKKVKLLKGYELYLDTTSGKKAKARVEYAPLEE